MTAQYLRKLSIVLGASGGAGLDFADFRVTFSVRRGDIQTPNSCDVKIYNIADATATRVQKEFDTIILQAGYEGNFGLIFKGTCKQIAKGREDTLNTYLQVTAADGDEAYNFSYIAQSLAAGTTPDNAVAAFLQHMPGITQGYKPELKANGCVRGRVYYGAMKDVLRDFAATNDCLWSFQNGQLTLIPQTSYIPGQIPVISPSTGLVGQPQQMQNGIAMRILLNPFIKIGQLVKLDSKVVINPLRYSLDNNSQANVNGLLATSIKTSADGTYYVMRADHTGDTRGNAWFTDLICLAVDATVPASFAAQAAVAPAAASIRRD